jgi:hypothetical protein
MLGFPNNNFSQKQLSANADILVYFLMFLKMHFLNKYPDAKSEHFSRIAEPETQGKRFLLGPLLPFSFFKSRKE